MINFFRSYWKQLHCFFGYHQEPPEWWEWRVRRCIACGRVYDRDTGSFLWRSEPGPWGQGIILARGGSKRGPNPEDKWHK